MGSLKAKDFITTLINTGADASLNLFQANISLKNSRLVGSSLLSFRITSIPQTPTRDVVTQDIPYMGTSISIPVAGSTLKRSSSFVIRVDENYKVYSLLRKLQCVNDDGVFTLDKNNRFDLKIEAMRPTQDSSSIYDYCTVYEWDFSECYITTVSPLAYNYDSSNSATSTVGFIFRDYDEFPVQGDSSLARVTPQGLVQGGISDLRDLAQLGINKLFGYEE